MNSIILLLIFILGLIVLCNFLSHIFSSKNNDKVYVKPHTKTSNG